MTNPAPEPPFDHAALPQPRKFWQLNVGEWIVVAAIGAVLVALLFSSIQMDRGGTARFACKLHLQSIGLALHNYHEKYGVAPPAFLLDEYGKPAHSWRVLILPFLDRSDLYEQYRFDEPWDGPNNRKLADQIGNAFHCPSDRDPNADSRPQDTSYVAVVGPETYWRGSEGVCPCDIYDGMSTTLQLVEVANSGIHWMEPRDLRVLQMAPTINANAGQGISSRHKGGAFGLLADGAVRFFSESVPAETIRSLLTIQGGETIPDDF
jgi:hypothetical protein